MEYRCFTISAISSFFSLVVVVVVYQSQLRYNVPFGYLGSSPYYEFISPSLQADMDAGLCMFYDLVADLICNA